MLTPGGGWGVIHIITWQRSAMTASVWCPLHRNCGNVFCASCCDQKIPVPSQQLFEPSRVCKSCYGSLQPCPSLGPLDTELDKGITASSK